MGDRILFHALLLGRYRMAKKRLDVSWNREIGKDDLSGRILETMKRSPNAPRWEVISFPAIARDPIAP